MKNSLLVALAATGLMSAGAHAAPLARLPTLGNSLSSSALGLPSADVGAPKGLSGLLTSAAAPLDILPANLRNVLPIPYLSPEAGGIPDLPQLGAGGLADLFGSVNNVIVGVVKIGPAPPPIRDLVLDLGNVVLDLRIPQLGTGAVSNLFGAVNNVIVGVVKIGPAPPPIRDLLLGIGGILFGGSTTPTVVAEQ